MRVISTEGGLQQYFVEPTDSYDLSVVYVRDIEAAEARISMRLEEDLDLEREGPVCAELLELSADDHIVLLILHHCVTDAYADDLFIRELLTAYDHYVRDRTPAFPPAMTFSEYVAQDIQAGDRLTGTQLRYWRDIYRGYVPAIPKRSDENTSQMGARGCLIQVSTTAAATRQLEDFASASKVSLMAVMCSVIFLSVWKEYGLEDICAFVTSSGRDSSPLKTLIASTIRTYLLRVGLDEAASIRDFARKIQTTLIRGSMSSQLPFTNGRALSQLSEEEFAGGQEPAVIQPRAHLRITDASGIQKSVAGVTGGLAVERVMPGPLLKKRFKYIAARQPAPSGHTPPDSLLHVLLRRDLSTEPGEPITFLGSFTDDVISEDAARALLDRMCHVAERVGSRSQDQSIVQVLS